VRDRGERDHREFSGLTWNASGCSYSITALGDTLGAEVECVDVVCVRQSRSNLAAAERARARMIGLWDACPRTPHNANREVVTVDDRVFAIHDIRSGLDHPLGGAVEVFVRREDAERSSRK
jgi:hypothetical protein